MLFYFTHLGVLELELKCGLTGQSVLLQAFCFWWENGFQMPLLLSALYKNTTLLVFHNKRRTGPFSLLTMRGLEGEHAAR